MDKAAGLTGVVSEMFMADKDFYVEWLTSLCNFIIAHETGRVAFCYQL